jgi:hypothetical protein
MTRRIYRWAVALLALGGLAVGVARWLEDHPQHNPWAPLRLSDPIGWATGMKLARLRQDRELCRNFLGRSELVFTDLPPRGTGACLREDRVRLAADRDLGLVLRPGEPDATCAVQAGLALWLRHGVQPAATEQFGSRVVELEHLGTASCRRIGGGDSGRWSEHATGNAIDVAGFVLEDGRRVTISQGWDGAPAEAAFLRQVREAACGPFATVLSPDYNAAHADHIHLDQAGRSGGWGVCR